ncbi:hypothetical protein KFK09_006547 [Dendrobium nobile]|uniref:Uncharacterized protein n=1 Tax=Dendrobium nobile TaxID=94219 RepID=A0A8T3BTV0_DENNO|nr:hypothetical protein KFK09_006547 [Dendrobium nobile]
MPFAVPTFQTKHSNKDPTQLHKSFFLNKTQNDKGVQTPKNKIKTDFSLHINPKKKNLTLKASANKKKDKSPTKYHLILKRHQRVCYTKLIIELKIPKRLMKTSK